jgi:hypothetical protein
VKCSPDYGFVICGEILNLPSIDQVLGSARAPHRTRACIHKTRRGEVMGELRNAVNACAVNAWDINTWNINAWDNGYRAGHGMIGTVLIAFAGEPLTILVLIAR